MRTVLEFLVMTILSSVVLTAAMKALGDTVTWHYIALGIILGMYCACIAIERAARRNGWRG